MKIAIHIPNHLPFSIKNYIDNVVKHLKNEVDFYEFSSAKEVYLLKDKVDIYWLPYLAGGAAPSIYFFKLFSKRRNIVVTLHGAAPFALPPHIYYKSKKEMILGECRKQINRIKWFMYRNIISKIITVSYYSKKELQRVFKFSEKQITYIHHGVDFNIYNTKDSKFGKGK